MKRVLLSLLLMIGAISVYAQYNYRFQQEYFFGWLPSPRSEGMGQADVAVGGETAGTFRNPASIGLINKGEFTFSNNGPFYALGNSRYYFLGAAYRVHERFILGLSYNRYSVNQSTFSVDINGTLYPIDEPVTGNLALTAVGEIINGLHVGLNFNWYRWKIFNDVSAANAFMLDAGVLYTYYFSGDDCNQGSGIRTGISFTNATAGDLTFKSPMGDAATADFPVVGRYGITYFNYTILKPTGKGINPLGILGTFEIQNVFNSEYRTAFRLGLEALAYEFFAFRCGFFTFNTDNLNLPGANKSRLTAFTYGFGLKVPVQEISNNKVPLDIQFDFTAQKSFSYTFSGTSLPNMRAFAVRLIYQPCPKVANNEN